MFNKCNHCSIECSNLSNLRAHVKRKHKDNLEELYPESKRQQMAVIECPDPECSSRFVNNRNLRNHIHHKHAEKELLYAVPTKLKERVNCPMCDDTALEKEQMISHFSTCHGIDVEKEKREFSNIDEFESWKTDVEEATASSFIKMHGSSKTMTHTRTRYSCHRSGHVRQKGTGQRRLKAQGSKKLNGFCPAGLDLSINKDGKCQVEFLKTHVGHQGDLEHLFLTKKERAELASKIASGIPFQNILDDVRDSISESELNRLHLLKRKDLYNIEKCFQLRDSVQVRDSSDIISVESCVNDLGPSVLFCKEEGISDDDNNFLVDSNAAESENAVKTITKPLSPGSIHHQKSQLLEEFFNIIDDINTPAEVDAVRKILAPMRPILEALRNLRPSSSFMVKNGVAKKSRKRAEIEKPSQAATVKLLFSTASFD